MELTVREPDPHHNHWGMVLTFEQGEDCWEVVPRAMRLGDAYSVFHQGGHHLWGERCSRRHYLEFWSLDGDEDHRQEVQDMIAVLR